METAITLIPGQTKETQVTALLQSKELPDSTLRIIKSLILPGAESLPALANNLNDTAIFRAGGGSQLSKIKKEIGEGNLKRLLAALIFDLSAFYNVKGGMDDRQVDMLVNLLISNYWTWKIEQFARAFHLQKMGKLIKIYDRVDPATVIEVLNVYHDCHYSVYERDALSHKEEPVSDSERQYKQGIKSVQDILPKTN